MPTENKTPDNLIVYVLYKSNGSISFCIDHPNEIKLRFGSENFCFYEALTGKAAKDIIDVLNSEILVSSNALTIVSPPAFEKYWFNTVTGNWVKRTEVILSSFVYFSEERK